MNSDILLKYNTLPPDFQKEVNDFLDFLLAKYKGKKKFDIKSWKQKIKDIPAWNEDDLNFLEEGKQHFNSWNTEEW